MKFNGLVNLDIVPLCWNMTKEEKQRHGNFGYYSPSSNYKSDNIVLKISFNALNNYAHNIHAIPVITNPKSGLKIGSLSSEKICITTTCYTFVYANPECKDL